ncbi:hypothetical protein BD779DRAFT_1552426 [Infundibulicybe gibba]|nr:hypothetical protein BD779DRAFT_1552426 [Infundibulicybe gibba]
MAVIGSQKNDPSSSRAVRYPIGVRADAANATATPSPSDEQHPNMPMAGIIDIMLGTFVILVLLLAIWHVSRKNKSLWTRIQKGYMVQSQFDITSSLSSLSSSRLETPPLVLPVHSKHHPPSSPIAPRPAHMSVASASTLVAEADWAPTRRSGSRMLKLFPGTLTALMPARHAVVRTPSTRRLLEEGLPGGEGDIDVEAAAGGADISVSGETEAPPMHPGPRRVPQERRTL